MISKKNLEVLKDKRDVTEVSLVFTIGEIIKTNINIEAYELFNKDLAIHNDSAHSVQVIMINKWFTNLLLTARCNNDELRVDNVLMCITNDMIVSDWVKIYNLVITPYITKNNVL